MNMRAYARAFGLPFDVGTDPCDTAGGAPASLTAAQVQVHAIARRLARSDPSTRPKGVLVWHSTGSGKLCASVCIMDAMLCVRDKRPIFFVTNPAALQANPIETFARCAQMLPRFRPDPVQAFRRHNITLTTFAKMTHAAGLYRPLSSESDRYSLSRAVLIIDEAHTMFRPLPAQRAELEAFVRYLQRAPDVLLFLLTATPGQTPQHILKLLNLLVPPSRQPLRFPDSVETSLTFVRDASDLISRFDGSRDHVIFPRVRNERHDAVMSTQQLARYMRAVRETAKNNSKLTSVVRFSNGLFDKQHWRSTRMSDFSCKLVPLLDALTRDFDTKHVVYSAFYTDRGIQSQGVHLIANAMEVVGFERLDTRSEAFLEDTATPSMFKKQRYAVVTAKALSPNPKETLARLLRLYNCDANKDGGYLRVLLVSQNYFESIDLKAVRHVHIFEPMTDEFSRQQLVGRAVRRCSHNQLNSDHRDVVVHDYIAHPSRDIKGVDDAVRERSIRKFRPIAHMMRLMEIAAIDCDGTQSEFRCWRDITSVMPRESLRCHPPTHRHPDTRRRAKCTPVSRGFLDTS
jgi:hypothetical protein